MQHYLSYKYSTHQDLVKSTRALRELNIAISEPLVITLENSERAGKVPKVQERANTGPLFKKRKDKETEL